jgi:hypothetical protein
VSLILPPAPRFADTEPCPPPCAHHVLSADGYVCLACNDDITCELVTDTVTAALEVAS